MIAVDTNVLVYAHRAETTFHVQAYNAVVELAEGARPWGIPVVCLHEFLAVVTNPRVFEPPSTVEQAFAQAEAWLASPTCHVLHSGEQHVRVLGDLARRARIKGGQFHDARIAAICVENGASELWTADRDFSRYKGLKMRNPML
ncbi:MAG: type II toxin-antitoxin system VapC family toxin [Burkholderiales bacterium]